jgi:hypothetical protein
MFQRFCRIRDGLSQQTPLSPPEALLSVVNCRIKACNPVTVPISDNNRNTCGRKLVRVGFAIVPTSPDDVRLIPCWVTKVTRLSSQSSAEWL